MAGRRPDITEARVLEKLWELAAGDEGKPSERLKALELLGRHLGMFRGETPEDAGRQTPVIIYGMPEDGDE